MSGEPYPKSIQTARAEKRYVRRVASPKQWQAIAAAKQGPCRTGCGATAPNELHHVLSRAQGGGDCADNIVPLCTECHALVTRRDRATAHALLSSLTDEEYAYAIVHGGEDFFERSYGLRYSRG